MFTQCLVALKGFLAPQSCFVFAVCILIMLDLRVLPVADDGCGHVCLCVQGVKIMTSKCTLQHL